VSAGAPGGICPSTPGSEASAGPGPCADRRQADGWDAALTGLGIIVLAAADLDELHQAAHPAGCGGCRICRATLPLLQRVVAATRAEPRAESSRPREDRRRRATPPPEGA
jgi:hypothetical protein